MRRPDLTIVIPTLYEAARIRDTIAAARRAFGERAEYLVVDATPDPLTARAAGDCGATVLRSEPGRGVQLATGVAAARAPNVLLLHADTLLPRDAAPALFGALADPRVSGGAFRIAFLEETGRIPWKLRLLARMINMRSCALRTATGDQAIFARGAAIEAVGGVPTVPLFEDVLLYRALRDVGQVRLLGATVQASPRRWLEHGVDRTILLHLWLRALHAAGVSPHRLAAMYGRERAARTSHAREDRAARA